MSRLRVESFTISIDGFGAGPDQSLDQPMGAGSQALHAWGMATRTFQSMMGEGEGATGIDDDFASRGFENIGAWIMGRNMFGPQRGVWPDEVWQGWWGEEPPYHCEVYVLTHHPRASFEMKGGTTFHFVTEGLQAALQRARAAAGGKDIRLGGGVATIREALQACLVDEMHLAISPVLLGRGEALLAGLDLPVLGYGVIEQVLGENAAHIIIRKIS